MSDRGKGIFKAVIFFLLALSCVGSIALNVKSGSKAVTVFGAVFFSLIGLAFLRQALRK